MEISVLDTNFLTYVVKPFSYPQNYKKTKQSHFATTSRPVEGFSHEDSSIRGATFLAKPQDKKNQDKSDALSVQFVLK